MSGPYHTGGTPKHPLLHSALTGIKANHDLWHDADTWTVCREIPCHEVYHVALVEGYVNEWPELF